MYDLNMIILYIIFPFSTKVLDTVLKGLCPFFHILCIYLNSIVVYYYLTCI